MAWYAHFKHEWRSDSNELLKIELQKETAPGAGVVELNAPSEPFVIKYPQIQDKLSSVRGNGATINLYSTGDLQLAGLVHAQPKDWKVVYTKDGVETWWGFISRDTYSEPYTEFENYPVTLQATNGFALLDEIKYIDTNGENYAGITTQWQVIKNILEDHWGFMDDMTWVSVGLSTRFVGESTTSSETILHHTFVKQENYLDEDPIPKPMSCRKVLESILKPYGAHIIQVGDVIYIQDVNTLAGGSTDSDYKLYLGSFTYFSDVSLQSLEDVYDRGIYRTGGTLKSTPPGDEFTIRYSKYKAKEITTDITNESKMGVYEDWTQYLQGDDYWVKTWESHSEWYFPLVDPLEAAIKSYKHVEEDTPETLLKILNNDFLLGYTGTDYTLNATTSWSAPYFIGGDTSYLKISGEMKPNNLYNPYDESTEHGALTGYYAEAVSLGVQFTIGDYSYYAVGGTWELTSGLTAQEMRTQVFVGGEKGESCMNQWGPMRTLAGDDNLYATNPNTEEDFLIRLDDGISGYLTMSLYGQLRGFYWNAVADRWASTNDYSLNVWHMYLKDFAVNTVKLGSLDKDEEDPEFKTTFRTGYDKHKHSTTINHGNSTFETPIDNGALLHDDGSAYDYIERWHRGIGTSTGSIESLLMNTLVSNYSSSNLQIEVELNNTTDFPHIRWEDNTYLPGSIFMYSGGTLNPTRNSEKVYLIEINPDTQIVTEVDASSRR